MLRLQLATYPAAAAHYISALDGYAAIGDDLGQADVIGLIGALGIESNPIAAARLIGAAQSVYARNDVQPTSPQAMRVSALQDRLRALLGTDEFERERAVGQAWAWTKRCSKRWPLRERSARGRR